MIIKMREIAAIVRLSPSTVEEHLRKTENRVMNNLVPIFEILPGPMSGPTTVPVERHGG